MNIILLYCLVIILILMFLTDEVQSRLKCMSYFKYKKIIDNRFLRLYVTYHNSTSTDIPGDDCTAYLIYDKYKKEFICLCVNEFLNKYCYDNYVFVLYAYFCEKNTYGIEESYYWPINRNEANQIKDKLLKDKHE